MQEKDSSGKTHGDELIELPSFLLDRFNLTVAEVQRYDIWYLVFDDDSDIQHDFQSGGSCLLFSVCSTELGLYGKFLKISKFFTSVVPCSSGNFFIFSNGHLR